MNSQLVRYDLDLKNLPPLSKRQKKELAALIAMPDHAIDSSDIPPLSEDFWKSAVRFRAICWTEKS